MIIITGLGRTGTSFMALWLKSLGLIKYEHGYTPEVNAGIEPIDVSSTNNLIIAKNPPLEIVEEAIKSVSYDIIKDPRFLYGNVLEHWLKVRKDLKFLVLHREPSQIVKSRQEFMKTLKERSSPFEVSENGVNELIGKFINTCLKKLNTI